MELTLYEIYSSTDFVFSCFYTVDNVWCFYDLSVAFLSLFNNDYSIKKYKIFFLGLECARTKPSRQSEF